jgi:hypothetical protein
MENRLSGDAWRIDTSAKGTAHGNFISVVGSSFPMLYCFLSHKTAETPIDALTALVASLISNGKVKIKVMTDGSWQKRYGRNFFTASAPTSVSSHMRMAQLHKQDGQGAVALKVLKTRGIEASSPETEKKPVEMDKMRKKKRRWHIFLFIRPKIKCY